MSEPTPLRCPACKADMRAEPAEAGPFEVDVCPSCHGLWLDRGELERLVPAPAEAAEPLDALALASARGGPVVRRCPRCARRLGALQSAAAQALRLDECPEHGVFLDAGELETIRQMVASGALAPRPRPEPTTERRPADPLGASPRDNRTPESERTRGDVNAEYRSGRFWDSVLKLVSGLLG